MWPGGCPHLGRRAAPSGLPLDLFQRPESRQSCPLCWRRSRRWSGSLAGLWCRVESPFWPPREEECFRSNLLGSPPPTLFQNRAWRKCPGQLLSSCWCTDLAMAQSFPTIAATTKAELPVSMPAFTSRPGWENKYHSDDRNQAETQSASLIVDIKET